MDHVHGAAGAKRTPAAPSAAGLVERLRERAPARWSTPSFAARAWPRVAALAAERGRRAGGDRRPAPRRGGGRAPGTPATRRCSALRRYVADRVEGPPGAGAGDASRPRSRSRPATTSSARSCCWPASAPATSRAEDAGEFLHLAAVASLTEVAVEEAQEEVEENLRGSFLEDLRSRPDLEPREIVRRAARLGCDLSRGAVVLCAELTTDRPRHVVATISGDEPGALAQHIDGCRTALSGRVYALLPGRRRRRRAGGARWSARAGWPGAWASTARSACRASTPTRASSRARSRRPSSSSTSCASPRRRRSPQDIGTGTYRLLFRVLASHPEEVRCFYEDTVAPIVRYDDQYRTDLVGTLESYLEQNCNMNATAAAIYAHRHTVAYRLDRVKELTGLDPMLSEDRERLGLGLKAYRIIAPRLPK